MHRVDRACLPLQFLFRAYADRGTENSMRGSDSMQTRRWGHGIFENNNNKLQQILYAYPTQNSDRLEIVITKQDDDATTEITRRIEQQLLINSKKWMDYR